MKELPIGIDNFQDIINGNYYYIDKTKILEKLCRNQNGVILFTRPRRFGKTLLMSMIENFFNIDKKEENKELFNNLYISNSEYSNYQAKYPTIFLTFKDLKGNNYDSLLIKFKLIISSLYEKYNYLYETLTEQERIKYNNIVKMESSNEFYEQSLKDLTEWLHRYHNEKVVVLIDEYDTPIQEAYLRSKGDLDNNSFYNKTIDLIRNTFSQVFKTNFSLQKGILTGILKVSKESMFSTFNNPKVNTLISNTLGEYFGFTHEETKEIFNYYNTELTNEVSKMYDGYLINGVKVYNPWSIINYLDNKKLLPYWVNTSSNSLIEDMLKVMNEETEEKINDLLTGKSITFNYDENITYLDFNNNKTDNVMNLLFASGYLTIEKETTNEITGSKRIYYKLPNLESKTVIIRILEKLLLDSKISSYREYDNFTEALVSGRKKEVEEFINKILGTMSYYDEKEAFYHGAMLTILNEFVLGSYIVKSNREAGSGRLDLILEKTDRKIGLVFELKLAKDEKEMNEEIEKAIVQIEDKEYYKELELDKIEKIYKYSICFYKKKCIVR